MAQFLRPIADISNDTWLPLPVFEQINEVIPDDSDFSDNNRSTPQELKVKLSSGLNPITRSGHTIRVRFGKVDFDTAVFVQLTNSFGPIRGANFSLIQPWQTFEFTLTELQALAITDYADLFLRIKGSPSFNPIRVSWAEMEIPDPPVFTPPVRATIDSVIHPRNVDSVILKDEELDSIMNV